MATRKPGKKGPAKKARPPKTPKQRLCGAMEVHERLMRTVPGYREARDRSENYALRASYAPYAMRTGCTKIPVVVHVVYKTAAQNISDPQINSQIDVLNEDFRMVNADSSTVPAAFAPLADDARIEFELATTDPDGNPTTGITRTLTSANSFSGNDDVKSSASGGADAWPAADYLNMWVCQLGGGLLGYAQFPGGPAATDGVVITHTGFGTTGTAAAPFNLGRTATHEIGHWLNLRHIWGDDGTGCSGSDFVADTPNQGGPNVGVPTFPSVSCSNGPDGDMFMNYMDYVDDAAMVMFSAGQVTRMQAALDSDRSTIGTTIPCGGKPLPKDLPKDPPKELHKDPPKEFHKDPPKEFHKEFPKDFPKEFPKDLPKDGGKDLPKDAPKDFHKDPGWDTVKPLVNDLPKAVRDPQKSLFEPPVDFPGPFGPMGPGGGQGPFGPMGPGGGLPFVLATPTGAGPGGRGSDLAAGYLRLLTHYAQLHARGMLDADGIAAWQDAMAAYQQLIVAGGTGA